MAKTAKVTKKRAKAKVETAVEAPTQLAPELMVSTIRPGLLVSLKTSLRGNVQYFRDDVEKEHKTEDGGSKAVWTTEKVITDVEEHKRATQIRDKARGMVRGACIYSTFGLLCPEGKADNLTRAIADARRLIQDFNSKSVLSKVDIFIMSGQVVPNNVEAMKALRWEMDGMIKTLINGVEKLQPDQVRDAAARIKALSKMLAENAAAKAEGAADLARKLATKMVKAVKAGEDAAKEIDKATVTRIKDLRTAFLDLSDAAEIAAPVVSARKVEAAPAEEVVEEAAEGEVKAERDTARKRPAKRVRAKRQEPETEAAAEA